MAPRCQSVRPHLCWHNDGCLSPKTLPGWDGETLSLSVSPAPLLSLLWFSRRLGGWYRWCGRLWETALTCSTSPPHLCCFPLLRSPVSSPWHTKCVTLRADSWCAVCSFVGELFCPQKTLRPVVLLPLSYAEATTRTSEDTFPERNAYLLVGVKLHSAAKS